MTLKVAPIENENDIRQALDKYSTMVYRICFMYLKNKYDAEDACQDVFLKYVQCNKEFESEEHEKAWLCKVTFNRCKDVLKYFNRRLLSLDHITECFKNLHKGENKSDRVEDITSLTYESIVDDHTVLNAVLDLPSKYKDVIYLHFYEGYTAVQIAKIKKCNENTIYSQISRAKKMLKERLGDEYEC